MPGSASICPTILTGPEVEHLIAMCPGVLKCQPVGATGEGGRKQTAGRSSMHDRQAAPVPDVCTEAVAKALASVRANHRANPDLAHMTRSAIAERVTALTLPPRP